MRVRVGAERRKLMSDINELQESGGEDTPPTENRPDGSAEGADSGSNGGGEANSAIQAEANADMQAQARADAPNVRPEIPRCPPQEYCDNPLSPSYGVSGLNVTGNAPQPPSGFGYEERVEIGDYRDTPYTNAYRHEPSAETLVKRKYPRAFKGDEPLPAEPASSYYARRNGEVMLVREMSKKNLRGSATRIGLLMLMYIVIMQALGMCVSMIAAGLGFTESDTALTAVNTIIYVLIYPVSFSVLLMTANVGERHTVRTYFSKPQCSGGYIFKWCVLAIGLTYLASVLFNLLTALFTAITGIEIYSVGSAETFTSVFDMVSQFVILCGFAPFFEELFFRGALLSHHAKYGGWHAVLVTAMMFGLFHQNIQQFVYTAVGGIFMALVVMKTGSVISSMIIHAVLNGLAFMQMLFAYFLDNYNELLAGEAMMPKGPAWAVVMFTFFNALPYLLMLVAVIMIIVELCVNRASFYLPAGDSRLKAGEKAAALFTSPSVIVLLVICAVEMAIYAFVPM